jgi:K+-sensing histidine kinase KdpD
MWLEKRIWTEYVTIILCYVIGVNVKRIWTGYLTIILCYVIGVNVFIVCSVTQEVTFIITN